jgi:hypothetical protein
MLIKIAHPHPIKRKQREVFTLSRSAATYKGSYLLACALAASQSF